jgi:tetratricopeptide (TPR) repeat protein
LLTRAGIDPNTGVAFRTSSHHHSHHHHGHHHHGHHHGHRHGWPHWSGLTLFVGHPPYFGDYGYAGYGYWPPYYLDNGFGALGPFIAPPIYVPAEKFGFGPMAVRQFMGLDPIQRPVINRVIVARPAEAANVGNNAGRAVRASNAEARDRAMRFVEFGDVQFESRQLAAAYERYQKATEAAPDLAEAYFRQGHTLVEMRRYEQAARVFRRGLDVQPDWPTSKFRLEKMYGNNRVASEAMLVTVTTRAAELPADVDLQFVAGVQHFFDGQFEKARPYFEGARRRGEPARYVEGFLKIVVQPVAAELDI